MKHKFLTFAFIAVLIKSSQPSGVKGGSFSGSFSSSSSSSQSSSSSSSSSGSFTATGSLNDIGSGFKDLVKGFANSGAAAGSAGTSSGGAFSGSSAGSNAVAAAGSGSAGGAYGTVGKDQSNNQNIGTTVAGAGTYGPSTPIGNDKTSYGSTVAVGGNDAGSTVNIEVDCNYGDKKCSVDSSPSAGTGNIPSVPSVPAPTGSISTNPYQQIKTDYYTGTSYGNQAPSSYPAPTPIGQTTTGTANQQTNTGTYYTKKPCCTGPYPGPVGSIHDYKPASSVPSVPSVPGAYPQSGGSYGNQGSYPQPGASGASYGTAGSVSQSGVTGGSYPQFGGSYGPAGGTPVSRPIDTSSLPGPSGSIHASKPASSVPSVPIGGYYPGSSSSGAAGSFSQSSGTTGGPAVSGTTGPVVTSQLPGPAGSIHESKPAPSVPSVPIGGGYYPGSVSSGSAGSFSQTTGGNYGTTGGNVGAPVDTSLLPGPSGSIHASKPASSVPSVPVGGGYYPASPAPSVPSGGGYYPASPSVPSGGYYPSGGSTTQKTPCCKGPFPGPHGSIHDYKPASSVPAIGPVPSWGKKPLGYGPVSNPGWDKHIQKPGFIVYPPVVSDAINVKPVDDGSYKPYTPDVTPVGVKNDKIDSGSQQAQGLPDNVAIDTTSATTDNSIKPTSSFSGTVAASDSGTSNAYNNTNENAVISQEPGYATGNVEVQKQDGTGGKYEIPSTSYGVPIDSSRVPVPTGSTAGSFGSTAGSFGADKSAPSTDDSGFATGGVAVQKPGGSYGSANSGALSGSFDLPKTGSLAAGSFGGDKNGYATGSVVIQKQDGSYDSPSANSGAFSSAGSGAFASSRKGGYYGKHDVKSPLDFGSFGSFASAGAFGGAGSYAGSQGGGRLLGSLFSKHNVGAGAASGAFAKSHSYASSSSYAGASAGSYAGTY